jgi:hypothetical protein
MAEGYWLAGSKRTGNLDWLSSQVGPFSVYGRTHATKAYYGDAMIGSVRFDEHMFVGNTGAASSVFVYSGGVWTKLDPGQVQRFPPGTYDVIAVPWTVEYDSETDSDSDQPIYDITGTHSEESIVPWICPLGVKIDRNSFLLPSVTNRISTQWYGKGAAAALTVDCLFRFPMLSYADIHNFIVQCTGATAGNETLYVSDDEGNEVQIVSNNGATGTYTYTGYPPAISLHGRGQSIAGVKYNTTNASSLYFLMSVVLDLPSVSGPWSTAFLNGIRKKTASSWSKIV